MPDIHVPGIGNVPRGGVIAGAVIGVGGALFLWYRHKTAAATSTAPASSYGYGSNYGYGGYGYTNPAFNEPYIGGEYGYGGVYGYGIGVGYGVGSPYPPTSPPSVATTNAAWAQAAESYLINTGGYDPETVSGALGVYISGGTLSSTQQAIVEAAIAFEGYPPQAGASGYPPAMHTTASTGQGGGGGTGGGGTTATATVPITFGMSADKALAKVRAAGFNAETNPIRDPKNTYISKGSSPRGGSKAAKGSHVTLNVAVLKRGK